MPGYKANAKNTTNGASFSSDKSFYVAVEDQRMQKIF